jgi:hypothetical protein
VCVRVIDIYIYIVFSFIYLYIYVCVYTVKYSLIHNTVIYYMYIYL